MKRNKNVKKILHFCKVWYNIRGYSEKSIRIHSIYRRYKRGVCLLHTDAVQQTSGIGKKNDDNR